MLLAVFEAIVQPMRVAVPLLPSAPPYWLELPLSVQSVMVRFEVPSPFWMPPPLADELPLIVQSPRSAVPRLASPPP